MGLQQDTVERLRREIAEVKPDEAMERMRTGAQLIDIREPDELSKGTPSGSVRIGRSILELRVEQLVPDPDCEVLVMCASGLRSLFAAQSLKAMGYRSVRSLRGGFEAWHAAGLPIETPRILNPEQRDRYSRHLTIPEVGEAGQSRLLDARVALIGAGGLGSPIAYYLAAAGVGTLRIFDDDLVERSNLQRQILHTESRIGESKAQSAAQTIAAFNPDVTIDARQIRLNASNAMEALQDVDVVVDGSDNLATRQLLNEAALALGIPLVYGAIFRFEGQVSVFWPKGGDGGPCYRCLFPESPPAELTPSCAEAGVLGVLPGIIGTMMASETLKILLGRGEPLTGRLLTFDALSCRFDELQIGADPDCSSCSDLRHADLNETIPPISSRHVLV